MKVLVALFISLMSASALSHEICEYRFHKNLSVELVMNDRLGENKYGSITWDNLNTCNEDGCTEMDPGTFKVRFQKLYDREGALRFKIKNIDQRDDVGNRYRYRSALGRFIRQAVFYSPNSPDAGLAILWKGKRLEMECYPLETEE